MAQVKTQSVPELSHGGAPGLPSSATNAATVAGSVDAPARPPPRLTGKAAAVEASVARGKLGKTVSAAVSVEAGRGLAFLFLPVAMGAGAGLYYMAPTDPNAWPLAVGFLISAVVAIATRADHSALSAVSALAAALFLGSVAAAIEAGRGAVLLDSDVTTRITGRIEAREFDAEGRTRYLIRLESTAEPQIRRPPARVRLVARMRHEPAPVGALVSGRARLSSPSGPALPGGYDFAFRAFVDHIGAHGFFYRAPAIVGAIEAEAGLYDRFGRGLREIRERISQRIRSVLPGDAGGVAAALAVSDRRGISAATVEALRATGLAHILAISGLHMALAAGTLYIGLRQAMALFPGAVEAWPVKKFAAIGALAAATAYLAISGGSVPTQRAWVMLSIMLGAVLADRPALTMRNVALAAVIIIAMTPSAVVGPGFQMSFAATAALIAAYGALAERQRRKAGPGLTLERSSVARAMIWMGKAVLGLAITSLVAGLATGLFSAHHFHRVAGNGLIANLLAMPLVTFVVMPSGLAALLAMPFGLDAAPLKLMGLGLEGVIGVARYVEALGGDITVGRIPLAATGIAGAGFTLLVFLRSRLRLAGLALIVAGGLLAIPPLAQRPPDVLISEDGRLAALNGPSGLASNATRPSAFIFGQWQTALAQSVHVTPVMRKAGTDDAPTDRLDGLLAAARDKPSRFHCAGRGLCVAVHKNLVVIALDQPPLIGAACDRGDLVIVALPVYMSECRSGATLVTARQLRQSGSLAVHIEVDASGNSPGSGAANPSGQRQRLRIESALGGVIRPWTIQRYYDWRSQSYDLPE